MNRIGRDEQGVLRACDERGVGVTFEAEWNAVFGRGDLGALGRRIVSKGSSRGAGPKVKRAVVQRRGGLADAVHMCKHGNRSVQCASCSAWHCVCPGSVAHVCAEAA